MSRDITMKEQVFASGALTEIPIPPIAGTSYRKPLASDGEIKPGWKYRDIVDSAAFNEVMYRTTSLVNQLEKDGILIWSNKTNYPEKGIAKGPTDGKLYQAVQASGPGTPAGFKDCEVDDGDYWSRHGINDENKANINFDNLTLPDALTNLGFDNYKDTNGYQVLPGGLIIQWGFYNENDTYLVEGLYSVTLPIAFPTAALVANCTGRNSSQRTYGGSCPEIVSISTTQIAMFVQMAEAGGGLTTDGIYWSTIGY